MFGDGHLLVERVAHERMCEPGAPGSRIIQQQSRVRGLSDQRKQSVRGGAGKRSEHGEVDLAADHRGEGKRAPAVGREPLEPPPDRLPHSRRNAGRALRIVERPFGDEELHDLAHEEGVPVGPRVDGREDGWRGRGTGRRLDDPGDRLALYA